MKNHIILSTLLFILMMVGFFGGIRLSYINFLGISSCPHLGSVALCYIVTLGYFTMFVGLLIPTFNLRKSLFWAGWSIVFLIALVGTGFELAVGTVCPQGFRNIPLCYLSLALCTIIGILYKGRSTGTAHSKEH